ncbi:DUF4238 domain-containing protein [Chamaesiphon polymorphus]|uniref:DUF4238 domain-containing protein n=1 Tax=Chamaesiphon polymorphus CCALA 037 TaxID=2107692 RepID=A0A2T1GJC5_9CYAN|nr:DUF4238 domain-containing protein [Chamaesiphon polymorphus]PSB57884.1 hypothetical protein C7B77_06770 [Chamaesiphon polymorphus CCALA 037]
MAGIRQHFIPRFLQNGFASHVTGDKFCTWVYRKGVEPFNANTTKTGVEGYFYSQDDDPQVDDEITAAESRFTSLVNNLRNEGETAKLESDKIAELIAHFEIRTRHLRQSFSNAAEYGLREVLKIIEDPLVFGNYVKRGLEERVVKEYRKLNYPENYLKLFLIGIQPQMDSALSKSLDDIPWMTEQFRADLPNMLKEASKSGHIDGLRNSIAPQVKIDMYRNMKFSIERTFSDIPLGDSIVLFQLEGDESFKPISEKGDPIQAVYLPLSSNLVLVGQLSNKTPDLSQLPKAIAQCSLEYFISSTKSDGNETLQAYIGESAHLISKNKMDAILLEIIDDMKINPQAFFKN